MKMAAGSRETCGRCSGRGTIVIRLGVPGQDRHLPASQIEWQEPSEPLRCPVCLGTGLVKVRVPREPSGAMWVHYGPADTLPLDDILDRMGVEWDDREEPE